MGQLLVDGASVDTVTLASIVILSMEQVQDFADDQILGRRVTAVDRQRWEVAVCDCQSSTGAREPTRALHGWQFTRSGNGRADWSRAGYFDFCADEAAKEEVMEGRWRMLVRWLFQPNLQVFSAIARRDLRAASRRCDGTCEIVHGATRGARRPRGGGPRAFGNLSHAPWLI